MKKKFNITGTCYPELHYMMDNSKKFEAIMELIRYGEYFTIHHPRQYGKTTMLYSLAKALRQSDNYFAITLNFQGIDSQWHDSDTAFGQMFLNQLKNDLQYSDTDLYSFLSKIEEVKSVDEVSAMITKLVLKTPKKLVILIDEVDASCNYAAFVNFLGMLRAKFLNRMNIPTFHSIVLVGVHNIKNLKFKLRNPEKAQYNSPWNIAVDFEVDMSFNPQEIAPMLEEYSQAENVTMDIPAIAERLHYHTSGYPFLVTKLCKNIAEKILKTKPKTQRHHWTLGDVEKSVQMMLKEENTNFESLIKNLENHQDLYNLVYSILINNRRVGYNPDNAIIKKGITYGVFRGNGIIKIHNRVYEQRIYNYLTSNVEVRTNELSDYNYENRFMAAHNALNFQDILTTFQQFVKEQYSDRQRDFLESEWRLLFLAFLQPILNGRGYTFKEVQISREKRLDVVVTYHQYRYIIELKKWYGEKYHQEGLSQLATYLEIHGVHKGFLLIFDNRKKKTWKTATIQHNGKEIFAVWV